MNRAPRAMMAGARSPRPSTGPSSTRMAAPRTAPPRLSTPATMTAMNHSSELLMGSNWVIGEKARVPWERRAPPMPAMKALAPNTNSL